MESGSEKEQANRLNAIRRVAYKRRIAFFVRPLHICLNSVRLADHNNQINIQFYVYLIPLEILRHDSLQTSTPNERTNENSFDQNVYIFVTAK